MFVDSPSQFDKPGSLITGYRDFFTRIRDNLEEARQATTAQHMQAVGTAGEACFCSGTECQTACPLDKDVPTINELLKQVDFDYLIAEFEGVMRDIDAHIQELSHLTQDEYMRTAREGYVRRINEIIEGKDPKLKMELAKLERAFDKQTENSAFSEFTGMLCPATCETGVAGEGGCTIKASGARMPVAIKSNEYNLSSIGFIMGWTDKKFKVPQDVELQEKVNIQAGAGPFGLEVVFELAKKGIRSVVYDPQNEIGGLLNSGIPHHKMEKWRLIKYRWLMQNMYTYDADGRKVPLVEFKLGEPLTAAKYEAEQARFGAENVDLTLGVGVQFDPVTPARVPGFEKIKDLVDAQGNKRVDAAINRLWEHDEEIRLEANRCHKPERVGGMGSGDTATDVKQTEVRTAAQEGGHAIVFSDRTIPLPEQPRIGTAFAMAAAEVAYHSTAKEDDKEGGVINLYGATPSKFDTNPEGEIIVEYSFEKPKPGYHRMPKAVQQQFREPDHEVGAIRDAEGRVIGLRQRDGNNRLVDYPLRADARFPDEFSNKHLPLGEHLPGNADGTLTMVYDRFYYAMSCRGAGKHPLAQAFGLECKEGTSMLDCDAGGRTNVPGIRVGGDAGTGVEKWTIVGVQRNAKEVAQAFIDDARAQKQAREESRAFDWNERRGKAPVVRFSSLQRAAGEVGDLYRQVAAGV